MHLMRVGMDGTSSDVVANQWKQTDNTVYAPTANDPYDFTRVVLGRRLPFSAPQFIITNADQGAMYSWVLEAESGCAISTDSGCVGSSIDSPSEYHLTTTAGGAVASDVIWNGAVVPGQLGVVVPVLQLEDGSYVGSALDYFGRNSMVAFDASGNVKWTVPGYSPQMATADGGIIATSAGAYDPISGTFIQGQATTFDASGAATGQLGTLPTYSWTQQWYASTEGNIAEVALPVIGWGTSYEATAGGNASSNGTAIGVFEAVEGEPVFGFPSRGASCTLPATGGTKVPLGGEALQQYNDTKQKLLSGGYLTCPSCSAFFNADPGRATYFTQLTDAVTRQVPYDGPQTTISQYDAGMLSAGDIENNPTAVSILKKVPVCAQFVPFHGPNGVVPPTGLTTAASQIRPSASGPAADVYINTDPKALKYLTQGTILHEVLHNLTGLHDHEDLDPKTGKQPPDLKTFVGIPSTSGSTIDITKQLENKGCAAKP